MRQNEALEKKTLGQKNRRQTDEIYLGSSNSNR